MTVNNSKANADLEFFLRRIDETGMSELDRIRAKARFERTEAVAEAIVTTARAIARLFTFLTAGTGQPPQRPASSAR